jgi:hypothetical protein
MVAMVAISMTTASPIFGLIAAKSLGYGYGGYGGYGHGYGGYGKNFFPWHNFVQMGFFGGISVFFVVVFFLMK